MTRSAFVDAGERTSLLPKALTYGFSLDFRYQLDSAAPGPLTLADNAQPKTFHVSDRDFITTLDGALREVPKVQLTAANDFLSASKSVVNLKGSLLFAADTGGALVLNYTGVLNVPGGTSSWLRDHSPAKPATAFVYSRQDYAGAKYRSLVWNQLIGVGQFVPEFKSGVRKPEEPLLLQVSFDFYIPS